MFRPKLEIFDDLCAGASSHLQFDSKSVWERRTAQIEELHRSEEPKLCGDLDLLDQNWRNDPSQTVTLSELLCGLAGVWCSGVPCWFSGGFLQFSNPFSVGHPKSINVCRYVFFVFAGPSEIHALWLTSSTSEPIVTGLFVDTKTTLG